MKFGWVSGTIAGLGGAFILAVFLALFNYLTPSGTVTIVSRVTEVMPKCIGADHRNPRAAERARESRKCFVSNSDPEPFQYKVNQLQASLAQAKQQVKQLQASYEQATANVEGLAKQVAFYTKRLADYEQMVAHQAQSEFRIKMFSCSMRRPSINSRRPEPRRQTLY